MSKNYQKLLSDDLGALLPAREGKRERYYLGKKYPGVYFTSQEAKCMFYVINKLSSRETSLHMKINFRTVEHYRVNMRDKIGAMSKEDLIAKVKETNFVTYISHLERIC